MYYEVALNQSSRKLYLLGKGLFPSVPFPFSCLNPFPPQREFLHTGYFQQSHGCLFVRDAIFSEFVYYRLCLERGAPKLLIDPKLNKKKRISWLNLTICTILTISFLSCSLVLLSLPDVLLEPKLNKTTDILTSHILPFPAPLTNFFQPYYEEVPFFRIKVTWKKLPHVHSCFFHVNPVLWNGKSLSLSLFQKMLSKLRNDQAGVQEAKLE